MAQRNFEQIMAELETTVRKLESGDLPLDDSISAFESGMKLVKECEAKLKEAKGRIEKLVKDASGEIRKENFEAKQDI